MTLDGWSQILYNLETSQSIPIIPGLYCFTVVVFVSFFLLNLMLAVVMESYIESENNENDKRVK